MTILKIPIRENFVRDDSLRFKIDDSILALNAAFDEGKIVYLTQEPNFPKRYYLGPTIYLSPQLEKIFNGKDTTKKVKIKAIGSVLHELTHYYEMNFVDDREIIPYSGTLESLRQHMTQPAEINGYVVEAYYYLSFFNPGFLKKIMADDKMSQFEKFQLLIKENYRLQYPYRQNPF